MEEMEEQCPRNVVGRPERATGDEPKVHLRLVDGTEVIVPRSVVQGELHQVVAEMEREGVTHTHLRQETTSSSTAGHGSAAASSSGPSGKGKGAGDLFKVGPCSPEKR